MKKGKLFFVHKILCYWPATLTTVLGAAWNRGVYAAAGAAGANGGAGATGAYGGAGATGTFGVGATGAYGDAGGREDGPAVAAAAGASEKR